MEELSNKFDPGFSIYLAHNFQMFQRLRCVLWTSFQAFSGSNNNMIRTNQKDP